MLIENINTFPELENLFKNLLKQEQKHEIIYRGQSDSSWGLTSSLEREILKAFEADYSKLTQEIYTQIEKQHFENVKRNLSKKLIDQKLANNPYELWAIGQHLGLKTPLIDWTRSFYVALFFAFEEDKDVEYRSIFKLIKPLLHIQEKLNNILCIFEPETDYYHRLTAQQGLFTHWGIYPQIEDAISKLKSSLVDDQEKAEKIDRTFKKYNISNNLRDEIMIYLAHIGISHETIYPDLDGAIKKSNIKLNQILQEYKISPTQSQNA